MSVLYNESGRVQMFIKGAPDYLIEKSTKVLTSTGSISELNKDAKEKLLNEVKRLAEQGLRTLLIAYKPVVTGLEDYNGPTHRNHKILEDISCYKDLEAGPVIVGVVAL